ncbi:MAG: Fic family protein [Paludibacteraceae bacterium]|nr:Fic family protein [Paludibacteraceae bacterium]
MDATLTLLLSEVDNLKQQLDQIRPLPVEALQKIQDAFEIEYTYDSNRIEGNTLTLQETALVVNEGVTISGKSMREHLEAINHAQAIEFIKDIAKKNIEITEGVIKEIHGLVLHGIDKANAGKYRDVPVMIAGSKHIPPQPYLIQEQIEAFITGYQKLKAEQTHPVIISAYLHDELVKVHPFIDGNGRTSRLLMNLNLIANGYPITNLKSNNEAKQAYYTGLETSHTTGDNIPFYTLVTSAVRDSLNQYLELFK